MDVILHHPIIVAYGNGCMPPQTVVTAGKCPLLDGEQNQAAGECSVGGMSALRSPLTMTLVRLPGSGTRKHLEWKPRSTSLVDLGSKFQWKPRSTHPAHFNQLGAQVNPSRIPGLCSLGSSHPE